MSVAVEHGVALGVSSGRVSDFLRVVRVGTRRVIAMADGYTSGWDAGEVSVSAPVLDAAAASLKTPTPSAYRHARAGAEAAFDAARRAFVEATKTEPGEDPRGDGAQLTLIELDGTTLRATWLARMELSRFRGGGVHRVTSESPTLAIERLEQTPATAELTLAHGDLIALSCRRWEGTWMDQTRSDLLASLAGRDTRPEDLVSRVVTRWAERQSEERSSGDPFHDFRLVVAAVRV